MKIVLDLDSLISEGKITQAEYEHLQTLASKQSVSAVFNLMVAFGITAIASGILSFFPSFVVGIPLGVIMMIASKQVKKRLSQDWRLLGRVLMMVAALMIAISVFFATGLTFRGFLVVTGLMAVISLYAKEPFVYALILVGLFCTLGTASHDGIFSYVLAIHQPTLTILIFGFLWVLISFLNRRSYPSKNTPFLTSWYQCSVILVNLGFWGGSIWGDSLCLGDQSVLGWSVSLWVFVYVWVGVSVIFILKSHLKQQRWGVNLGIFFGTLLFYTRYFAHLKMSSWSVVFAGIIAILVAWGVVRYNQTPYKLSTDEA
jgi:iron complex transport system permease protein